MNDKEIVQVAGKIQNALWQLRGYRYRRCIGQLDLLVNKAQELGRHARRLKAALTREWLAAAEDACRCTSRQLSDIPFLTTNVQSLLGRRHVEVPKLSTLVDELHALHDEFDDVEWERQENALCATTESITLGEVYLGPFQMALHLDKLIELYERTPYYVIAVDPHPAATDEAVTHPHISNDVVCEGDGTTAIRAALEAGRITDFFLMVRSLLTTYNPDSPYISLSDWDGVSCYECGYVMDYESSHYCGFCDHAVCDECSAVCSVCGEIICRYCAESCEICESSLCPQCATKRCSECDSTCCDVCLEDGLCPTCKEERETNEDEKERQEDSQEGAEGQTQACVLGRGLAERGQCPGSAGVAIQPHSLGQVGVFSRQVSQ